MCQRGHFLWALLYISEEYLYVNKYCSMPTVKGPFSFFSTFFSAPHAGADGIQPLLFLPSAEWFRVTLMFRYILQSTDSPHVTISPQTKFEDLLLLSSSLSSSLMSFNTQAIRSYPSSEGLCMTSGILIFISGDVTHLISREVTLHMQNQQQDGAAVKLARIYQTKLQKTIISLVTAVTLNCLIIHPAT